MTLLDGHLVQVIVTIKCARARGVDPVGGIGSNELCRPQSNGV